MASESGPEGPDVVSDDREESPGEPAEEPSEVSPEEGRSVVLSEAYPEVASEPSPEDAPPEEFEIDQPGARPDIYEYYGPDVQRELRAEPWNFQFFQAVRLLERFGAGKPVGRFVENPAEEAVRFSSNPALVFPPSQIASLHWVAGKQPKMTVNFMGLVGQL